MNSIPTLNHVLDTTVARQPRSPGFVTESVSVNYADLKVQVLKAAAAFYASGIRKEDRIAICLRNSLEFVIAYLGLMRLGAIVVPINFMVRKVPELEYMLNDCGAVGLITQKEFLPSLLEAKKSLPGLRSVWSTDSANATEDIASLQLALEKADPNSLPAGISDFSSDEIATILYTSGTTGNPKGVMLSHANLVSNCDSCITTFGVKNTDVVLCLLPMFHTFAWTVCVLLPLRLGIKSVISINITPPKPWLNLMARYGVTLLIAIPPIFSVLAREARGYKGLVLRYWFFRKVQLCVSGAAPLNTEIMSDFEKAFGVPILEGYGLTETSPVATVNPPGKPRPGSVGLPIDQVQVRIIDDNEKPVPQGQEGEICIKGPNVMRGYFGKPKETKETFTADGWFKTGDMGEIDKDGYLYIRGRKKDMIIIKGLKVFAAQVEHVIATHPSIEEVAVIGIPERAGDEIIKAFIVLKTGVTANKNTKAELMKFFREKLDPYKRPRDIEFLDSLPKNAMQKVLKRVLLQKEIEQRSS